MPVLETKEVLSALKKFPSKMNMDGQGRVFCSEAVAFLDAAQVALVAAHRRGALQESLVAAYNLSQCTHRKMVNYSFVYRKSA